MIMSIKGQIGIQKHTYNTVTTDSLHIYVCKSNLRKLLEQIIGFQTH